MTPKELERMANSLYKKDGWNQMPHIRRVVQQAEDISKRLNKKITTPGYAALYLHDVGRNYPEYKGINHGPAGAIVVRKLLEGKLPPRSISIVANAIAEHDYNVKPRSSVSNLLMSADANRPDLPWIVRKLYLRTKQMPIYKDLSEDELHTQTARYLNTHQSDVLPVPPYYGQAYKKDLKGLHKKLSDLTPEQVPGLIAAADSKYGKDTAQE